ncbi:MAG: cryptochrome/photolyase family protein [Pseudomonadota bacterium]
MAYHTLRLILGDQLNHQHSWFKSKDSGILYVMAELKQEVTYVHHHIQKVCGFFLAMKHFADTLESHGHHVVLFNLEQTHRFQSLTTFLKNQVKNNQCKNFEYQRPDEWRLLQQLRDWKMPAINKQEFDTEHFILPFEEIEATFPRQRVKKMEFFYREMRKRHHILMENQKPLGGKWNYDHDNRKSLTKADIEKIPKPKTFKNSITATKKRIEHYQFKTIGSSTEDLLWPVTRQQALELMTFFCQQLLPQFGRFQDAMTHLTPHAWSLYHSRLSFALNIKLLHPLEVIEAAISHYEQDKKSINLAQVEGFVRQILGWREFVRGIYWAHMPDYAEQNALDAHHALPEYFWTGETQMACMKHAINQSLTYAYAHHIQRLMVTGNFCLITGIDPEHVDHWYLGIYMDAVEWVEMPNARGMSQFADNGIIATKPYASSGSYINRMSDYCKSCAYKVKEKTHEKACPFNSLYWHFLARHQEKFSQNQRMAMMYRQWDKVEKNTQKAIIKRGDWCIDNLEEL